MQLAGALDPQGNVNQSIGRPRDGPCVSGRHNAIPPVDCMRYGCQNDPARRSFTPCGRQGLQGAMNYLNLHLRSDRASYFREHGSDPIVYDRSTKRWIVTSAKEVVDLLKDPRLLCPSIAAGLARLEQRFGVALPNLIYAAGYIPLLNEGAPHLELRRHLSRYLAGRREQMAAAATGLVGRYFSLLERQGEVELVDEVLRPLVTELFSALFRTNGTLPFTPLVTTQIFDHWSSLSKLLAAEAAIGEQRRAFADLLGQEIPQDQAGPYLALVILGRDSLLSTLGDSLATVVSGNPDRRLDEIGYPAQPAATGVAIAERTVSESFDYAGTAFREGDWVRLYFHALMDGHGDAGHNLMFGVGAHACLGRHLSLDLWQVIIRKLASIGRRAEIVEFAYHDNHVFVMPRTLLVRLH